MNSLHLTQTLLETRMSDIESGIKDLVAAVSTKADESLLTVCISFIHRFHSFYTGVLDISRSAGVAQPYYSSSRLICNNGSGERSDELQSESGRCAEAAHAR